MKQDILRQSLAEQLKWRYDLELYAAIYESNDDNLIHLITKIRIDDQPLSSDGAHLIGSLMARCNKLDLLYMDDCNLDSDLLRIMAKSIGLLKIQISEIYLGFVDPEARDDSSSLDFAALNNFLEHNDSDLVSVGIHETLPMPRDVKEDGQRCEFDWKNIRLLRLTNYMALEFGIYFRNMDDSIMLTLERNTGSPSNYFGSYNKKSLIDGTRCYQIYEFKSWDEVDLAID